tara:strand:- start:2245 stop:3003 length:759 start_codon:yes stop_codon:yes gene_type:complete
MENSNIKADYVFYCDSDIESNNVNNISQLSEFVYKYNFGDLVAFSDYRDTDTYIIGKEGELVRNPDYSDSGYLTIPYEITKYLDNAVEKYSNVEAMYIDLRYDDKFILENINTKSCKILEKWKWELTWNYNNNLYVKFPNGKGHEFNPKSSSAYTIKKWYEASHEEQTKVKVYYEISDASYYKFLEKYGKDNYEWLHAEPKIPSTWSIQKSSSGGGSANHYCNYIYHGPSKDKEKIITSINKFYKGFNYKIS